MNYTNKTVDEKYHFKFDLELTKDELNDENYILCKRLLEFMKIIYFKDYQVAHITKIKEEVSGIGVGISYKLADGDDHLRDFIGYRTYHFNNFKMACEDLKNILVKSIIAYYSCNEYRYEVKNYTQVMMTMDLLGI